MLIQQITMATLLDERTGTSKKHEVLELSWRRRIEAGEWGPGYRLPPLTTLCDLHDVSRSTVDRVCRSLEQDGLIVRRQGSGTYVAPNRPRLTNGLLGFSGFGFQQKPRPSYWSRLQEGIEEVAASKDKAVLLLDHASLTGWDKVDGVLLTGSTPAQISQLLQKLPAGLPRVILLTLVDGEPCVTADDAQSGRIATHHLLSLGHRRIAYMMDEGEAIAKRRIFGYREALEQFGIEALSNWRAPLLPPDASRRGSAFDFVEHGYETMRRWLKNGWYESGCTGLLVQNDLLAAGVLQACHEEKLSVPQELSVIGFDNLEVCRYLTPQLTSVEVPLHEVGAAAAELLLRQIETGSRAASTVMLPVQLRQRKSTVGLI